MSRGGGRVAFAVSLVLAAPVSLACSSSSSAAPKVADATGSAAVDYDYRIPSGAAVDLAKGTQTSIFPEELDARVGQVIRIVNDDDHGHTLGPFFVAAKATMVERFASPGVFTGTCSVHLSGTFVLKVTA